MKIVNKKLGAPVTKALTQFGSSFALEDFTPDVISRKPLVPQLLSTLLIGDAQKLYGNTDTFVYDSIEETAALPSNKQYTGYGDRVAKDLPETFRWAIPSFGVTGNIAVQDYANRRAIGTLNDADTEAQHVIRLEDKIRRAWDLFSEQQALYLLTTDKNLVGDYGTEYDFYGEVLGGSRGAATKVFEDGGAIDEPFDVLRAAKRTLQIEMAKSGEILSEFVCIAGSEFFQRALDAERATSLVATLAGSYQFLPEIVTETDAGEDFKVDNFYSTNCGIKFIEYPVSIGGTGIGSNDAYLVPVRSQTFVKQAFAPAMTREYANTEALSQYAWVNIDDREGITRWEESNYLLAMTNPRLKVSLQVGS